MKLVIEYKSPGELRETLLTLVGGYDRPLPECVAPCCSEDTKSETIQVSLPEIDSDIPVNPTPIVTVAEEPVAVAEEPVVAQEPVAETPSVTEEPAAVVEQPAEMDFVQYQASVLAEVKRIGGPKIAAWLLENYGVEKAKDVKPADRFAVVAGIGKLS